ncbi:hypothetical protein [Montanilutibacter psychrotolerans]|uniref:hypothetical protein n=1 Tax=Montanilutibacter psychrotolerans TaxID=1327343 RepID=UPI0011CEBB90|nr:hypothetical protein [Lysobacter psychrotolerans]
MKIANLLLAFCLGVTSSAIGGDVTREGDVNGSYLVKTGPFEIDPDPEDRDVRVYLSLKSDGARAMYEAIEGGASNDFCGDKETWVKHAGDVICFKNAGGYECVFALNMHNGKLENAAAC